MEQVSALYAVGSGSKRRFTAFGEAAAAPDSNVGQLHLFVGREWVEPNTGEKIDLSGDAFEQMIRNFRARESKTLSIDYDHKAWHPTNPDSKAAGWITDLSIREGESGFRELWATVEWTDAAAAGIRAREWKFCSPAFVLGNNASNKTGNDIGAELLNVALTNVPFQDGLTPIRLSLASDREEIRMADAPAEEKPAEDKPAAEEKPEEEMGALNAFIDLVAEGAGVDRMAAVALLGDNIEGIVGLIRQTADKDGAQSEMSTGAEPVTPAADAAPAAESPEVKAMRIEMRAMQGQFKALSQHVEKLNATAADAQKKRDKEATEAIAREADQLIADGYALDADRDDVVYMLTNHRDRALRLYSRKVVPVGESQAGATEAAAPVNSDDPVEAANLNDRERSLFNTMFMMGRGMAPHLPEKVLRAKALEKTLAKLRPAN